MNNLITAAAVEKGIESSTEKEDLEQLVEIAEEHEVPLLVPIGQCGCFTWCLTAGIAQRNTTGAHVKHSDSGEAARPLRLVSNGCYARYGTFSTKGEDSQIRKVFEKAGQSSAIESLPGSVRLVPDRCSA